MPLARIAPALALLALASCDGAELLVGADRLASLPSGSGGQPGQPDQAAGGAGGGAGSAGASAAGQAGAAGASQGGGGSGGAIVAGPIDQVIAAMPPGSWKELPGTTMASVCPAEASAYDCEAVMIAWSGGAFDTLGDRLLVFGGGYDDSFINSVFAFDLASGSWARLTDLPAGMNSASMPPVFLDKRVEPCGLYPQVSSLEVPDAWLSPQGYLLAERCDEPSIASQLDPQQPRSTNSLGNLAFSAATGRFYLLGSASMYPSGQATSRRVMGFDLSSRKWSRGADNVQVGYGVSATDAEGRIWYLGHDGGTLAHYDPAADVWAAHQAGVVGYHYAGIDVDTKRNHLLLTQDGLTMTVYDLASPDSPALQPPTTGLDAPLGGAPGAAYLASADRLVAWSGGRQVHLLDPSTWAWTTLQASGDDPGPAAQNGTFGRFRYSPKRKVFVAVSSATRNVFLLKPP